MIDILSTFNSIVNEMSNVVVVEYDEATGKSFTCNTKWARPLKYVVDVNDMIYKVTEVVPNVYIKAEPVGHENALDGAVFLPNPFALLGTQIATNMEWQRTSNDIRQKTPFIWLLDTITYTESGAESSIEYDVPLRIFFLDETNSVNYKTKDHQENVVQPMNALINEFLRVVNTKPIFKKVRNAQRKTFSRFGSENAQGTFKNILDADFSGVELRINLVKYKEGCSTSCNGNLFEYIVDGGGANTDFFGTIDGGQL